MIGPETTVWEECHQRRESLGVTLTPLGLRKWFGGRFMGQAVVMEPASRCHPPATRAKCHRLSFLSGVMHSYWSNQPGPLVPDTATPGWVDTN